MAYAAINTSNRYMFVAATNIKTKVRETNRFLRKTHALNHDIGAK